jgi:AcrR family transcriptional regulator
MNTTTAKPPVPRRSRLSADREREILEAALALVAERGYARVTMQDIATASRSSTATLYRRWSNKAHLVAAALERERPLAPPEVDTGTLRSDLEVLCHHIRQSLHGMAAGIGTLTHQALAEPELGQAVHRSLVESATRSLRTVLARYVRSGVIAADNPSLDLVDGILLGSALTEQLRLHRDPELCRRIVQHVLLPLLTPQQNP